MRRVTDRVRIRAAPAGSTTHRSNRPNRLFFLIEQKNSRARDWRG
jgi:hypothetical protein